MAVRKKKALKKKKTPKQILRDKWSQKFSVVAAPIHKQFTARTVARILRRVDSAAGQIAIRSRKYGVSCTLTVADLRQLAFKHYGKPCKFCKRQLVISMMVFDHIIPISKNGPSTKDNMQIICKACNGRKGSLDEGNFMQLLAWLETMPEDFKRDVLLKLSGTRR